MDWTKFSDSDLELELCDRYGAAADFSARGLMILALETTTRAVAAETARDSCYRAAAEVSGWLNTANKAVEVVSARVAELQAELAAHRAAHRWRPVTEPPVVTMQYQVVVQHSRQQPTADHMAYYPSSGWTGTDVIFWRPIPPLPPAPAPQEPTP